MMYQNRRLSFIDEFCRDYQHTCMNKRQLSRKPRKIAFFSLHTREPTHFGSGWMSGVIALSLALLGLGVVLCIKFPSFFTLPELRSLYPMVWIRALVLLILSSSFLAAIISLTLRQNKAFGVSALALLVPAVLMGGHLAPLGNATANAYIALDWHLLNLIFFCLIFIPLERAYALRHTQPVFRPKWRTDLLYFANNHIAVQTIALLVMLPAKLFFGWAVITPLQVWVQNLWLPLQLIGILLIADFCQYWIHRTLHVVPCLWRFHAIHHSVETMDWLAGSRLHLADVLITRGLVYVPLFLLGFSETIILAYGVIIAMQATFIHANVRWRFRALAKLVVTPQFHHWHHSSEPAAIDKNFAVHVPIWDRLFGTYYMPQRWPKEYGLAGTEQVPNNFWSQFWYPFKALFKANK